MGGDENLNDNIVILVIVSLQNYKLIEGGATQDEINQANTGLNRDRFILAKEVVDGQVDITKAQKQPFFASPKPKPQKRRF